MLYFTSDAIFMRGVVFYYFDKSIPVSLRENLLRLRKMMQVSRTVSVL
jgi:hypothetical protein